MILHDIFVWLRQILAVCQTTALIFDQQGHLVRLLRSRTICIMYVEKILKMSLHP
ncbi:hypothetical protein PR001_g23406 [Phytophthora rubi]|uniref:Uncharacterized protein n=1 Tax=Phytophthora rubi TaxID=129364 RepID=A0A6A3J782_9STRA|nr:hypothetical protein PR001_g23406 [Phytophthora rubi]KAE8990212.1 hypothetical protein PR002_g21220 [Phytophthora rubi]